MTNSTIKLIETNIKKHINKKNLTQEKLSKMCGISIDYLSEIERNKKTLSLKRLILIAEKLNIPAYKLFLD